MTKQVDLNQGLFFGEGLENQFLHAYYFVVSGKLLHQTIDVELGASLGGSVCDLLVDDAGLVFAELAQNLGSGNVNCGVHILVGFFYADDVAACAHGNLALSGGGVSRILFDLQYNLGSKGVDVHDLHGVADFFFGISADGIRDGHLAAGDGDFHDFTSQTETNFAVFRGAPHETGMSKTTIHAVRNACWMHLCSTFCNGRRFRISPRQPSSLISLAHFFLISSIKMNLF